MSKRLRHAAAIGALVLTACGPVDPNSEWCNAADDGVREILAKDSISASFLAAPRCTVMGKDSDTTRIVSHGYVTALTKRNPVMPYVAYFAVLERAADQGRFWMCGVRFIFPGGSDELVKLPAPGCHVDLDAALKNR